MIRLLLALWLLAAPVAAETARVLSGEHADFTRLVIELPNAAGWAVGRTAMGYGFATLGGSAPGYDLAKVWERIPRTRLQALRTEQASGALLLTLACDCHVFPFEYQPGTIVLDIRDGPAPAGSAFEAPFSVTAAAPAHDLPPMARSARDYDWLDTALGPLSSRATVGLILPEKADLVKLDHLRDELLLQLSRGAAEGVVDMALAGKPSAPDAQGMGDIAGALIRIGELPGLEVGSDPATDDMDSRGRDCLPDEELDLASWGDGRPPLDLLAEARSGLYGEFDSLSSSALLHAIKLHLYLGFGAEALQYGALLPGVDGDTERAALRSMARLIDGDTDPMSPFATMLGCDGTAAMWAALAYTALPTGSKVNTDAIARSFQALPAHLRRHLGPKLVSLLIDRDAEAARMIRNAVERTPDVSAGTVALIDAEADLQAGNAEAAMRHAETAAAESGTGLSGLVALVEAHLQSGEPLASEVADALLAYRDAGSEDGARRARATVLALALSGREDEAFALSEPKDPVRADLWRTLARLSADGPFLSHAVLRRTDPVPSVAGEVALAMAVRLDALGFPEAALAWIGPVSAADTGDRRRAAARAELALGNARGALQLLAGLSDPDAKSAQAAAFQQLGAYDAAKQALDGAGKPDDGARLATWDADWSALKEMGSPAWADAAALLDPKPGNAAGPLAEGQAAIEDSAAARQKILALLAEVPTPTP
jgi:hypothetical protein